MKQIEIKSTIDVYTFDELSALDQELLLAAKKACDLSYAPYSNFKVGCAIRMRSKDIVIGANQENAAYPVCLCAEGVALSNASMQYPNSAIETMAITIKTLQQKNTTPAAPCGVCRQRIAEYENRYAQDIRILLQGEGADIYIMSSVKSILPLGFGAADLNES